MRFDVNTDNFILVIIVILVYVIAQRVTLKQLKTIIDKGEKKFKQNFNTVVINSQVINDLLDQTLYHLNADRIYIFQYHNGGSNIQGIPFARCSNTHERCEVGVEPHIQNYQNLPLAMYGFRNDVLANGSTISIPDIEAIKKEDKSGYNLLKSQHIKSIYVVGLYTENEQILGFLGVDYVRDYKVLRPDQIDQLQSSAKLISNCITRSENE